MCSLSLNSREGLTFIYVIIDFECCLIVYLNFVYFSMLLVQLFTNDKHKDCIGSSGETWTVLRKVIHTAIQ